MAQYYIMLKDTEEIVDTVVAESTEEVLEDYDYSEEFFDIKKAG